MNGLALCAGAGGLELGISLAVPGYRSVGYVERDAYAAAALVARMEEASVDPAPVWDDLATFDGRPWRGTVDLVSAGFPCPPFSTAGSRRGVDDERWLWPDIERIVREVRPGWLVLENVPGLVRDGRAFGSVLCDLARLGFDAEWDLFSAGAVGAPHLRERLFLLAHAGREGDDAEQPQSVPGCDGASRALGFGSEVADTENSDGRGELEAGGERKRRAGSTRSEPGVADADEQRRGGERLEGRSGEPGHEPDRCDLPLFPPGPADLDMWTRVLAEAPALEPSVCGVADGMADRLEHRADRLRTLGNGVVPLAAAYAIRALAARGQWRIDGDGS